MNNNIKIEKIFCEIMELKKTPRNFEKLKMGSISQWDSLGNMNLLMALEQYFNVRLTIQEMSEINSVLKIKSKFLKSKK